MVQVSFHNDEGKSVEVYAREDCSCTWEIYGTSPGEGIPNMSGGMEWEYINQRDQDTYKSMRDNIIIQAKELLTFMQSREEGYRMVWDGRRMIDDGLAKVWEDHKCSN
jgi:hypothetical protein